MSAFKDGVDAGLSDFKDYNSGLGGLSLGTSPDSFQAVTDLANKAQDFIAKMQSCFGQIGATLQDDAKSWADGQKQRLADGCTGMLTQSQNLASLAAAGLDAANQAASAAGSEGGGSESSSDDGGSSDGDSSNSGNSDAAAAQEQLKQATDALTDQIEVVRDGLNQFYDLLRDVDEQFKNAIALAKNGVDGNQSQLDQMQGTIGGLESQAAGKASDAKALYTQLDSATKSYTDLSTKIDDKLAAEQNADKALADGARKDPPLGTSNLQSLEQASAAARKDREQAEADRANFWQQTLQPASNTYWAKINEAAPLKQQVSTLKQQRDTLIDGLNKARTAFAALNQEYQEPSL